MNDTTYNITVGQAKKFLQDTSRALADAKPDGDMSDNRGTIIAALLHVLDCIPSDVPVREIDRMLDKCGVQWE